MRRALVCVLLVLGGCSPGAPESGPTPFPSPSASVSASPSPTPSPVAFRFAAVGDFGDGSDRERRVAEGIAAEHRRAPIELLLLLGDMIYPGGDPALVEKHFRTPYGSVLEAGIDTAAVLGNHDIQTDTDAIIDAFGMPARYYTFSRGGVDFFALDSSRGFVEREQVRWFERALQRSIGRWRVAFMHVPIFSAGQHGPNGALQRSLVPLLDRYDVHLMITGHDHDYQRSEPIRGTVHIVSGGGCCPRAVGTRPYTARATTALHFVVFEATAERLSLTAIRADGKVIDRSVIS